MPPRPSPSPSRNDRHNPEHREMLIRLPNDLHAQLAQRARDEDRHMVGVIRQALRRYLEQPA